MTGSKRVRRGGFTLVELLVVILIISILFGLTAAAVMRALGTGPRVVTRSEITQLTNALTAFKTQYEVDYVPAVIVLKNNINGYNLNDATEAASAEYIRKVWSRIGTTPNKAGDPFAGLTGYISWDGTSNKQAAYVLYGHQALVFFLGGKLIDASPAGFATDATNPMSYSTNKSVRETRVGPFYDFNKARLMLVANNPFPAYRDGFDPAESGPYLYFSAAPKPAMDYPALAIPSMTYAVDGKSYSSPVVKPYLTGPSTYANNKSFQIISAGRDKKFGTGGGAWAGGPQKTLMTKDVMDDIANFWGVELGISQ